MPANLRQHLEEQHVSETLENLDRVLQRVHVIPEDYPVPDVSARIVRQMAQTVGHAGPGDVGPHLEAVVDDGRLDLAQHAAQVVLGLVELPLERAWMFLLVLGNLLQPHGDALEVLVDVEQSRVHLQQRNNVENSTQLKP